LSGRDDESGRKPFAAGIDGVKPMAGRDRNVLRSGRPAAGPHSEATDPADPFIHPDPDRPRLAQRRSAPKDAALRLYDPSTVVDDRVDLHGSRADHAAEATRRAIDRCLRSGGSVLLVIHGRGRHSGGHGVLRDELPAWLEAHPRVVAYAPAREEAGGEGATLVRLRAG